MAAARVQRRTGWRGLLVRLLPWYDERAELERDRRTAAVTRRAIAARIEAEQIREAYRRAAQRVER